MVTEASTPDFRHLNRMLMPAKKERPSTANTMCLILKPRQEDYKQLAEISGSENERDAYRKNRVIQMKLGAYLAEVCLQQRSSARLLKTEEYRFMQEVSRRSSVPRSVSMLRQLQTYTDKRFPNASYSYYEEPSRNSHRHAPLSARSPTRASRHQNLLDRPKTSATLFRQNLRDAKMEEDLYKILDNHEAFVSSGASQQQQNAIQENVYLLQNGDDRLQRPTTTGFTTELPSIWGNKENVADSSACNLNDSQNWSIANESDSRRKLPKPLERSKSFVQNRQRHNSMTQSLKRMNTVGKFASNDLPIREEAKKDPEVESDDSFEIDPNIATLLEKELKAFDREEGILQNDAPKPEAEPAANNQPENIVLPRDDNLQTQSEEDKALEIIDLDVVEAQQDAKRTESRISKSKPKPGSNRNSFSRLKTEPVMPLRHNITSVLRQEKAKYEASQQKVKNYLHKMTSRDLMGRGLGVRDTTSAQSRRSSAARK